MAKPKGQASPVVEGFAESLERVRAGRRQLPQEQPDELIAPETETPAPVPSEAPPAVEVKIDQPNGHAPTTVRLSQTAADGLWDAWVHWTRTTELWLRQTELVSRAPPL